MSTALDPSSSEARALRLVSTSPSETEELACAIGERLRGGELLALRGDLGSGKTTFTRGLARGLGCPAGTRITSPTFTIEHVHSGRVPLVHIDAYRLPGADALLALGFDERLDGRTVVAVEWADRVADCLPGRRLDVALEHDSPAGASARRVTIRGSPEADWQALLEDVSRSARARLGLDRLSFR